MADHPRDRWNIHGQFTAIEQGYPAFRSPYEGANSLSGDGQVLNTLSATAFFGPALGTAQILLHPEIDQGSAEQHSGIAAFPSGEAQKPSLPVPRLDMDRLYVQQTFGLGCPQAIIETVRTNSPGRATSRASHHRRPAFGHRPFDLNPYAPDRRTHSSTGTSTAVTHTTGRWNKSASPGAHRRTDRVLGPSGRLLPGARGSNTDDLTAFSGRRTIWGNPNALCAASEPGILRLMAWATRANMGSYAAALAEPITSPSIRHHPDASGANHLRLHGQRRAGPLSLTSACSLGSAGPPGSSRSWAGRTATRALPLGTAVGEGSPHGRRPDDTLGLAGVVEGLSPEARAYFAAGGLGIVIGDGRLDYRPEQVLEIYYALSLNTWSALTFDYQFVADPAYNARPGAGPYFLPAGYHAEF